VALVELGGSIRWLPDMQTPRRFDGALRCAVWRTRPDSNRRSPA
jgi:hypothetical protein